MSNSVNENAFWEDARRLAESPDGCDFSGVTFPRDPSENYFRGVRFAGPANFALARFECPVCFAAAEFFEEATFDYAMFVDPADFSTATFKGFASFQLIGAASAVDFEKSVFLSSCSFSGAHFEEATQFVYAVFEARADFTEAAFQREVEFRSVTFFGPLDFQGADFHGPADLTDCRFLSRTDFRHAVFHDDVSFKSSQHTEGKGFHLHLPNRKEPDRWQNIAAQSPFRYLSQGVKAYRLARRDAVSRRDSAAALEYRYAEERGKNNTVWLELRNEFLERRRLSPLRLLRSLLVDTVFARWIFAYGARASRLLVCSLLVIGAFAWLYFLVGSLNGNSAPFFTTLSADVREVPPPGPCDPPLQSHPEGGRFIDPDTPSLTPVQIEIETVCSPGTCEQQPCLRRLLTCLYFSTVTFTTLGFGDYHPGSLSLQILAGIEAFFGAALMGMMVATLVNKFGP